MFDRQGLFGEIAGFFVPVHRDGHKFIMVSAALALLMFLIWPFLGWVMVLLTLWMAYFYRDPERVTPLRAGLVIAPADGRVLSVGKVRPPQELGFGEAERTRVAIHLSLFDVHVNRSPVAARVARSVYVPGAFLNPTLEKTSEENERRALVLRTEDGEEIAVVQIAGVISRRIVSFAGEGDTLAAGQRYGLIRFGSRVDVYLPEGHNAVVCEGQRMVAGETVLADLARQEPERDCRKS